MTIIEMLRDYFLYCLVCFIFDLPMITLVWFLSKSHYKKKWSCDERPPEWCYRPIPDMAFEKEVIEPIEKALGFKLFYWQKTYLLTMDFRCYGETTAKALKVLLDTDKAPLKCKRPVSQREKFFISELREIKSKLDDAGIPTREVIF